MCINVIPGRWLLLQKANDSSSCPDCGMDPQDVPHLFNCTAHSNEVDFNKYFFKMVSTTEYLYSMCW